MTNELRTYYHERQVTFSAALESTNRKILMVSNLRLAVAILFLGLIYFGLKTAALLYMLPIVLVVFVFFVRRHGRLFREKADLSNFTNIQKYELYALDGDVSHNSSGSEFIDIHHPYTHDLDIFGEGSVFQYINRANTRDGKRLLADRLSHKPEKPGDIQRWQDAIRELSAKGDFRQEIQALSMQIEEDPDDKRQLKQWLSAPSFIYGKKTYALILNVFPPITVALVALAFLIDGVSAFAIMAAALQWVFLGFHLKEVNRFHQYISRKKNALEKYARILSCIRHGKYASPFMQSIGAVAADGDLKVRQLASLVGAFDARLNSMMNLFVNSLLLYDLQCVYRLERWRSENASGLLSWLNAVNETEVLCSLATFSFNHPGYVFPEINDDQTLTAKGLGHPLLKDVDRVVNDVHIDRNSSVMIVTGANMAGKSTFLRSLGVNVVLSLAGSPVCAEKFNCPFTDIRSGMRTADSLKENQSYFYAELDRLKSIMEDLRSGTPLLILLDEILKGTNSTDKQAGSIALVKQLVDHPCLAVIATHDLGLGELESAYPGRVANYSFEANIDNDQLSFDYKLKRGIAQKMNATFLMKKMGIIPR